MPGVPIEKLIQRQIHQWNRYRELLETAEKPEELKPRPTITISRERGSGARDLAAALAKRLDLEIHGVSLIDHIARDKNLEREVVEHLDEQARSQVDLWVKGVLKQRIFLRDNYHVSLVKAVKTLAAHGGVVIIGRGANFILQDSGPLRILMVASPETRVQNVMRYEDIEEAAAQEMIAKADESRLEFIRKLFHAEANDPHHYDLVLNTDLCPLPRMVEIAMTALEVRGVFDK
jgi:cytidylate kinase